MDCTGCIYPKRCAYHRFNKFSAIYEPQKVCWTNSAKFKEFAAILYMGGGGVKILQFLYFFLSKKISIIFFISRKLTCKQGLEWPQSLLFRISHWERLPSFVRRNHTVSFGYYILWCAVVLYLNVQWRSN